MAIERMSWNLFCRRLAVSLGDVTGLIIGLALLVRLFGLFLQRLVDFLSAVHSWSSVTLGGDFNRWQPLKI